MSVMEDDLLDDLTEPDEFRHESPCQPSRVPEQNLLALTDRQRLAFAVLTSGGSQTLAAREAGVTRQTVCTWANSHPAMRAALEAWRRAAAEAEFDRMIDLRERAMSVVADALSNGDVNVAVKVLGMRLPSRTLRPLSAADQLGQQILETAVRVESRASEDALQGTKSVALGMVNFRMEQALGEAERIFGLGDLE